jgi:hypothetical protein
MNERDVYLELRGIQTTRMFSPTRIPQLAGRAADEIERLRDIVARYEKERLANLRGIGSPQ